MALELDTQSDALRQKTLETAKRHKASWIELGQYLFSIHRDKSFKAWGFLSFETYCVKELGMKQMTATKLLKSYYFLEREEPRLADTSLIESSDPAAKVPNFESVNLLRLVKENEKLPPQDYAKVREAVIEKASEPKEVRAQVKKLLSEHEVKDPGEAKQERRNAVIKRMITVISGAKRELEHEKLLPDYLIKQMNELLNKLQDQIEN